MEIGHNAMRLSEVRHETRGGMKEIAEFTHISRDWSGSKSESLRTSHIDFARQARTSLQEAEQFEKTCNQRDSTLRTTRKIIWTSKWKCAQRGNRFHQGMPINHLPTSVREAVEVM
jgi:hypothetical protein